MDSSNYCDQPNKQRYAFGNGGIARLLKLLQFFQPCQYDILTCLFDLTREEYLVKDRVNLPRHQSDQKGMGLQQCNTL